MPTLTTSLKATLQIGAWTNLVKYTDLLSEVQQVVRAFIDEYVAPSAPKHQDRHLAHREGFRFTRHPDNHRVDQAESIEKARRTS